MWRHAPICSRFGEDRRPVGRAVNFQMRGSASRSGVNVENRVNPDTTIDRIGSIGTRPLKWIAVPATIAVTEPCALPNTCSNAARLLNNARRDSYEASAARLNAEASVTICPAADRSASEPARQPVAVSISANAKVTATAMNRVRGLLPWPWWWA